LCLFIGIIIYIGAVTGEASNRPKSGDKPRFSYSYGPSLALTFVSFISCELTAVLAVHLYISRHRGSRLLDGVNPAAPSSTPSTPPPTDDATEVDSTAPARPSNGRPPAQRVSADPDSATPTTNWRRGELQPLNDRRLRSTAAASNCSSSNFSAPAAVALQQSTTATKSPPLRHDIKSAARSVASSSARATSSDVKRRRHDVFDDYMLSANMRHHDALLSPSRVCVSLGNVRCVDDFDPFKRITPV